jgi:hypothetical protein
VQEVEIKNDTHNTNIWLEEDGGSAAAAADVFSKLPCGNVAIS